MNNDAHTFLSAWAGAKSAAFTRFTDAFSRLVKSWTWRFAGLPVGLSDGESPELDLPAASTPIALPLSLATPVAVPLSLAVTALSAFLLSLFVLFMAARLAMSRSHSASTSDCVPLRGSS